MDVQSPCPKQITILNSIFCELFEKSWILSEFPPEFRIIWINPFQLMFVWIAANFRINPAVSVWLSSRSGSTPLIVVCADRCNLWINPFHLWLCGSPLVVDQPLSSLTVWIARTCGTSPRLSVWIASRCGSTPLVYCLCGSPLTVDNSLVSSSYLNSPWLSTRQVSIALLQHSTSAPLVFSKEWRM